MMEQDAVYIIEEMKEGDWPLVRDIYLEGIATGNATFETQAPAWDKWDASHLKECRLVARNSNSSNSDDAGGLAGWAALSPVSSRSVYRGVAEVSVYVAAQSRGCGLGRALLEALVASSEEHGIWTLQAGILAENSASIELHERCGFRQVGRRERIGRLSGVWRDVVLMERRSLLVEPD